MNGLRETQSKYYSGTPKKLVLRIYNYVLKLRKEKNVGQRLIRKEINKKFGITISEATISGWIHHHNIPYNQERTQFKTKPKLEKKTLYDLYVKQKLSASDIGLKSKVSTIIVINWLRSYGIKVRTHKESMNTPQIKKELANLKLKRPLKKYKNLTLEKAYILGVLAGDGYINNKVIALEIRKDEEFIKEFTRCMEAVYGIKYIYVYKTNRNTFLFKVSAMLLSKDLLRYGTFRTMTWRVPQEILNSNNKKIISTFLKGLYDSDGWVSKYYVMILSGSRKGLIDVSKLLSKLGIENKFQQKKYPKLYINRKENLKLFKDMIGFTIKRKMYKLVNTYKLGW
ncbi:hypothetical protein CMO88_05200 [Candidatus Woesearchaeota archaeon]|nr:hypothetical protein [Candidatus Woesearchaeota archaeon]|tara:strand:+ start:41 stop:1060 length:1020 start_codon:yes stop_codon:yes gene_type:complete